MKKEHFWSIAQSPIHVLHILHTRTHAHTHAGKKKVKPPPPPLPGKAGWPYEEVPLPQAFQGCDVQASVLNGTTVHNKKGMRTSKTSGFLSLYHNTTELLDSKICNDQMIPCCVRIKYQVIR